MNMYYRCSSTIKATWYSGLHIVANTTFKHPKYAENNKRTQTVNEQKQIIKRILSKYNNACIQITITKKKKKSRYHAQNEFFDNFSPLFLLISPCRTTRAYKTNKPIQRHMMVSDCIYSDERDAVGGWLYTGAARANISHD